MSAWTLGAVGIAVGREFFHVTGSVDNRLYTAFAHTWDERPQSFIIGGFSFVVAVQLISLGLIATQTKRYFEELFHLGTATPPACRPHRDQSHRRRRRPGRAVARGGAGAGHSGDHRYGRGRADQSSVELTHPGGDGLSERPYEPAPWAPPAPTPAGLPVHLKLLEIVFMCGLAGVFLVNALVAMLQPSDFTGLVEDSSIARWLGVAGGSWVGAAIFVNDLFTGFAVLMAIWLPRAGRLAILGWAGAWLLVVAVVKITALDVLR